MLLALRLLADVTVVPGERHNLLLVEHVREVPERPVQVPGAPSGGERGRVGARDAGGCGAWSKRRATETAEAGVA